MSSSQIGACVSACMSSGGTTTCTGGGESCSGGGSYSTNYTTYSVTDNKTEIGYRAVITVKKK